VNARAGSRVFASHQFIWHPLNLRHIVVLNRSHVTVIPRYGDFAPSRSDYRAKIGRRGSPANAVEGLEESGLVAGHCSDRAHFATSDGAIVRFGV
jgi:hypothetical protein